MKTPEQATAEWVAATLAKWPPITPEQRARAVAILATVKPAPIQRGSRAA